MDRINSIHQQYQAFYNEPQTNFLQYADLHDEPNTFRSTRRPDTP